MYSFESSARKDDVQVLAILDETTYSPVGMRSQDLKMGADHPIIWSHCQGKGRALYSALGHQADAYAEPLYQDLLQGAIVQAVRLQGTGGDPQVDDGTESQISVEITEDEQ